MSYLACSKNWNVKEAYIKDKNNKILVDYKVNPLHLWSYSKSFNGEIQRRFIETHLYG